MNECELNCMLQCGFSEHCRIDNFAAVACFSMLHEPPFMSTMCLYHMHIGCDLFIGNYTRCVEVQLDVYYFRNSFLCRIMSANGQLFVPWMQPHLEGLLVIPPFPVFYSLPTIFFCLPSYSTCFFIWAVLQVPLQKDTF